MSLGALLAWPLLTAQVPAPPPAATDGVQWSAPAGCPDREALLAAVERHLGRTLAPAELAVDARVARVGPRLRLRLRLVAGDRGELRELSADTCPPLLAATALLIAHAVEATGRALTVPPEVTEDAAPTTLPPELDAALAQPDERTALAQPDERTPLAQPDERAPLARPDELDAPLAPPPARPRGPGLGLRAHGGPELGALPGVTGGGGLGLALLLRRLRLELHGLALAPRTTTRARTELRAALFVGSAHACARLGRGALELPLCGGLELGGVRAAARGPTTAAATVGPWLGVVLGAGVAWHLRRRLTLAAALQLVGGAVRPRFVLQGPGDAIILFRPAAMSGRLLLGLELRLRDPW